MLLYSLVEFITQAASSSGFIFCFCNLIIVIILIDLKPSLSFHQGSEIPVSVSVIRSTDTTHKSQVQKEEIREVSQEQKEDEATDNCSNEIEEEEVVEEEEQQEDEDDDDELRRRVEEFIQKVNKGWKAELLNSSTVV